MALSRLTASDAGASARAKINAIMDALESDLADLGTSDTKLAAALQSAVNDLGTGDVELGRSIADEATARIGGDAAEAKARSAGDAALQAMIESVLLAVLTALVGGTRPGLAAQAFSNSAIGLAEELASLSDAGIITTPLGRAFQMNGAGLIAPRVPAPWDVDRISVLRVRYWRVQDVRDPNNSALDVGIQWLDANGADVGQTLLRRETNLQVQDGPHEMTVRVPALPDDRPAIVVPKAAVSWRPYLRTWGADGATAVSLMSVFDATFAGVYAPDVYALVARMRTIEGQIAAGLPLATPILPSFTVALLPKAGAVGRKAFASDGRAPDAAGNLEAANAGTGVEVTDNGSKWVISGTNQQVQA